MKKIRESLGLSRKEFAVKLGLPYRTYQNWELGQSEPNMESLVKMLKVGINISWLLTGEGEMFLEEGGKEAGRRTIEEVTALLEEMPELAPFMKRFLEAHKAVLESLKEVPHNPHEKPGLGKA